MRARHSVLAVVVCIAVLMLALGLPTASARATSGPTTAGPSIHTIVVKPSGSDDTANLQAAFNTCTTHGWTCTIQLVKGTYYTAQVTAYGFQGSFVGMGQGVTIVQALPLLSPTADPFWSASPGPANPWPAMFTFENGAYLVSGMTLTEPYSDAVPLGWDASPIGGPTAETALFTTMEFTGLQAFVTVDHVSVLGAAGDVLGTNIYNAITFEGSILPPGWTNPLADATPISGAFSVTNSVFNSAESGPWTDTLVNAQVTVCYNVITNSVVPLGFTDASNSKLTFCGNQASNVNYGVALLAEQSVYKTNLPSTVYITGNDFQVGNGANAVDVLDFGPDSGLASTLSAVVSGNVLQTDTSCGCYGESLPADYSVIISESLTSLVVSGNLILGGGAAGIYVAGGPGVVSGNTILGSFVGVNLNSANGVHVAGNVIKNSVWWGIALTNGSSSNLVTLNYVKGSGAYDLYWDGTGTGNIWFGNACKTSSPPGLC